MQNKVRYYQEVNQGKFIPLETFYSADSEFYNKILLDETQADKNKIVERVKETKKFLLGPKRSRWQ